MVSFPQVSPPKPCAHLSLPPYVPHDQPITFFSIPIASLQILKHFIRKLIIGILLNFVDQLSFSLKLTPILKKLLSFLFWPFPPNHCRCTVLMLHLITHNGRTPLDEGSALRITHNIQKRQISMPRAGFEPANPGKRAAADQCRRPHGHCDQRLETCCFQNTCH